MAILGAKPAAFARYERGVALEYAHLPEELFRIGREHFVRRLLDADAIFLSSRFRHRLEERARANLLRSLETSGPH